MMIPTNIKTLLSGNVVEWARIEFKETWNAEASLKTICAFANDIENWGGGYIIIGVREENGQPQRPLLGIPPEKIDSYLKDMLNKCKLIRPEYLPIVEVADYEDKKFIVIWAPGGQTAPNLGGDVSGLSILKALGHPVAKCFPALVQLKTPPEAVRALKGIKYEGEISIWVDGENRRTEMGEVLFTDYGLSGPPVLQLSRWASLAFQQKRPPMVEVSLGIWPEDFHTTYQRLKARARTLGQRTLQDFLTGWLNKRLGQTLVKFSGGQPFSRPCSSLSDKELRALAHLMTDWRIPVVGVQGFAQAQVTAGGLDVRAFDAKTLESRLLPGLYCAGEVLDIDGDCGGFNLQWAWASGLLAAQSACDSL